MLFSRLEIGDNIVIVKGKHKGKLGRISDFYDDAGYEVRLKDRKNTKEFFKEKEFLPVILEFKGMYRDEC